MKAHILAVSDELPILLTLRVILEMNGYSMATAESAAQAQEKLRTESFDLVITKLKMETENAGYEVIKAAKQLKNPPAVAVLTAFPVHDQHPAGEPILVKPMNTQDLLRQIDLLLEQHRGYVWVN